MIVDYNNSKIYKIECLSGNEEDIYIGSTSEPILSKRMACHRIAYRNWKEGKLNNNIFVFEIFEKYGIENCQIFLIENFPCNSRDELRKREGEYIRQMNCVNKRVAGRTKQEYAKEHPEKFKEYYEANKEKN